MFYIYCITNKISNKKYIGKTTDSIENRFKRHCLDYKKSKISNRPLYKAMNKYGIENFYIEELEQISDIAILNDREKFWIQQFNTYGKFGYNATLGGDGKILYDYQFFVELFINTKLSQKDICNIYNISPKTIRKILKAHNISTVRKSKTIIQYNLDGQFIREFSSVNEIVEELKFKKQLILKCCTNQIKTAYNFIWEYK